MSNQYFDDSKWTQLPRNQLARAEAVNAIIEAIVVGFDQVPSSEAAATDSVTYCIDTGMANAYAIAPTTPIVAYAAGMRFSFKAVHANTGASTVNVSTIGVAPIKRQDGNDLAANDITAGRLVWIQHDGTNFQLMSLAGSDVVTTGANAASASASAATATAEAGIATTEASIATTEAGIATAQAGIATTQATNAAGSATAAAASVANLSITAGKNLKVDNTLEFAGTDSTKMTFPATSASIARTDAAQTFAGTQTFSGAISNAAGGVTTGGVITDSITKMTAGSRLTFHVASIAANQVAYQFNTDNSDFFYISDGPTAGYNVTASVLLLGQSATGRSIATGGTINASGSDYAEYETKAEGCGVVAKGQIVGFDADGLVTDKFSLAFSFGIKSTNPSYVGGDSYGTHEALGITRVPHPTTPLRQEDQSDDDWATDVEKFNAEMRVYEAYEETKSAALDVAREKVDRIAYTGKVPVNVLGATVGNYIIATNGPDDSILGQVIPTPNFDEYRCAVGRVRNILPDGRACVAVIVH